MLLHDLTIENFRSFEKYKLDKLARVNLLVGDNNCGKTSVLEAVALLMTGVDQFKRLLELRGDVAYQESRNSSARVYSATPFFRDGYQRFNLAEVEAIKLTGNDGQNVLEGRIVQTNDSELRLELITNGSDSDGKFISATLDSNGRLQSSWTTIPGQARRTPLKLLFVPAGGLTIDHIAVLWKVLFAEKLDRNVVDSLHVIDESITDIIFSPDTHFARDIWIDRGDDRSTFATFGMGMMTLLSLSISLCACRTGLALIDEIDTGLHYSRLANMWKMVITAAKKDNLDVQVFATTHSLDCIRGLAEAVRNDESFVDEVAVFRIDRRTTDAIRFSGEELEVIVDQEIEVRG